MNFVKSSIFSKHIFITFSVFLLTIAVIVGIGLLAATLIPFIATKLGLSSIVNRLQPLVRLIQKLFLISLIFSGYSQIQQNDLTTRPLVLGILLGVLSFGIWWSCWIVYRNLSSPHQWDFLAFYLNGQVAAQGLNFYDGANYISTLQKLIIPLVPGKWFYLEAVQPAFPYPPPTMLLLLPLGYLDFTSAQILWAVINIFVLLIAILIIWQYFLPKSGFAGLTMSFAAILLLPATKATLAFEQTSFFCLLFAALLLWDCNHWRAGLWLTLGVFIKPYMAILSMYFILRKQWQGIIAALLFGMVICAVTILVFDFETFSDYFISRSTITIPMLNYVENVNQSLLAVLLRAADLFGLLNQDFGEAMKRLDLPPAILPIHYGPYIFFSVVGAAITLWLVYKAKPGTSDWTLGLLLSFGLLVYPASLNHYSIVLALPMFTLYLDRRHINLCFWMTVLLIVFIYFIMRIAAFYANLIVWFIMVYGCLLKFPQHQEK